MHQKLFVYLKCFWLCINQTSLRKSVELLDLHISSRFGAVSQTVSSRRPLKKADMASLLKALRFSRGDDEIEAGKPRDGMMGARAI